MAIDRLVEPYVGAGIDKVAGIESRGFVLGGAVAHQLAVGFAPVRKKGKLPWRTLRQEYQLEYGVDSVEMHEDALKAGEKVLIIDDLLATGGTAMATAKLVERLGGEVVACCFVVELAFLDGRARMGGTPVESILQY